MKPGRSLDLDGLDGILSVPDKPKPKSKSLTFLLLLGLALISTALAVVGIWHKNQSPINVAPSVSQTQALPSAPQPLPTAAVAPETTDSSAVINGKAYDIVPNPNSSTSAETTVSTSIDNKINNNEQIAQPSAVPGPAPVNDSAIAASKLLFTVHFTLDSSQLNPLSKSAALELIEFAKHCPNKINVLGHTCNLGSAVGNMRLGLARAGALKNMLIVHGISGDRIFIASAGMTKPVASNASKSGQALNRRAELYCPEE